MRPLPGTTIPRAPMVVSCSRLSLSPIACISKPTQSRHQLWCVPPPRRKCTYWISNRTPPTGTSSRNLITNKSRSTTTITPYPGRRRLRFIQETMPANMESKSRPTLVCAPPRRKCTYWISNRTPPTGTSSRNLIANKSRSTTTITPYPGR